MTGTKQNIGAFDTDTTFQFENEPGKVVQQQAYATSPKTSLVIGIVIRMNKSIIRHA